MHAGVVFAMPVHAHVPARLARPCLIGHACTYDRGVQLVVEARVDDHARHAVDALRGMTERHRLLDRSLCTADQVLALVLHSNQRTRARVHACKRTYVSA